jgi:hypothetical protein
MPASTLEKRPVAKKKMGRPPSDNPRGEGIQTRIAPDVVRMGRKIAPVLGVNLADYFSDILRPTVLRDYARTQKMLEEQEGSK